MNILVTGGCGLVGSNLIRELSQDSQNNIISIDNYTIGDKENEFNHPRVQYIEGHTKDIASIMSEFFNPEVIYHFGEYSRVEQSFGDISIVNESNGVGTSRVLEYWRINKCRLVYSCSSTVLSNKSSLSPYTHHKKNNLELIKEYGKWYSLDYQILFFNNIYGLYEKSVGQYATVVGKFLEYKRNGRQVKINLPGTQKRFFTDIKSVINAIHIIRDKGVRGGEYEIGCQKSFSIVELAEAIGNDIEYSPEVPGNRSGSRTPDTKSIEELGWVDTSDLLGYISSKGF